MVFVHHEGTGRTTVVTTCPICQKDYELDVPTEGFIRWRLGEEPIAAKCSAPITCPLWAR